MSLHDIIKIIKHLDNKELDKIYNELIIKYNKHDVDFILYNEKKYIYEEKKEINDRRYQDKFRKELIKKYGKCIITGKNAEICEAAHIIPYSEHVNYDINNGLLLCRELHTLYDRNKFIIDPEKQIIIFNDEILNDESYNEYNKYNNTKINLNKKTLNYIKLKNI